MGTLLVIKNADFSANAVEVVTPPTPPTPPVPVELSGKLSGTHVFYLAYQGATQIQQQFPNNTLVSNTKLIVYNVEQYVGKLVEITSANYVISGAQYDCFSSDLGDLTYDGIENLSSHQPELYHPISAIESFNVTTTTMGEVSTIRKTIPSGTKYLCVTARFDEGLTEQQLKAVVYV